MFNFLTEFSKNWTGQQRLFAFVFLIAIVGVLLTLWTRENSLSTIIVAVVSLGLVFIASPLWLPKGVGQTRVRLASLVLLGVVAIPYPWWSVFLIGWFNNHKPDFLSNIPLPDASIPASVMIFVLVGIFIINYFMRDNTAMVIHPDPTGKGLGDQRFERNLKGIITDLENKLIQINNETNWSSGFFEPLDAEVEIKRSGKTRRKITKLLKAIREDQETRAFLVLGDPGSGKSVALRELAKALLEEVQKTGKIPVYLNLREWRVLGGWSKDSPPTIEQLQAFLLKKLKENVFIREFLEERVDSHREETMFSKLFKEGRFFLILDSFDEIPQVLDEPDKSWLIDELSKVIYRFITSYESRGILASRLFRCPTANFDAETVLEVRPFSEEQIFSYLTKKRTLYDQDQIKRLLVERSYLVPAFRNPFVLGLVPLYSRCYPNQFPSNLNELYQTFLQDRLTSVENEIDEKNNDRNYPITSEMIIDFAKDIAMVLFDKEKFGFEAPLRELIEVLCDESNYNKEDLEDVIEILESAKIVRKGMGTNSLFSFVHRRFAEYLVAKTFDKFKLPLDAIPKDTRWREALVLYCEVTDKETATEIAQYCWERVKLMEEYSSKMNTPEFLESIHCLRFLTTAFRNHLDCIQSFQKGLTEVLFKIINPSEDKEDNSNLLSVKFAVEALGLLKPEDTTRGIIRAFWFNSDWISETAIYACRSLSNLEERIEDNIKQYIFNMPDPQFILMIKELIFSFSLSDSFKNIVKLCKLRWLILIVFHLSVISVTIASNKNVWEFWIFCLILYLITYLIYQNLTVNVDASIISQLIFGDFRIKIWILIVILWMSSVLSLNSIWSDLKIIYIFHGMEFCKNFIDDGIINSTIQYGFLSFINCLNELSLYQIIIFGYRIGFIGLGIFLMIVCGVLLLISCKKKVVLFWIVVFSVYCLTILIVTNTIKYFVGLENIDNWLNMLSESKSLAVLFLMSLIIIFSPLIYLAITNGILQIKDGKHFKKLLRKSSDPDYIWTREEISCQFFTFKSVSGRLKFVQHLEEKRVTPPYESEWPEGNLPNSKNDQASTLLAKLEERWLGLHR
ncbi:MAG: NACHT domain-containing protein [Microcystaceae cyanobacterium]